MKHKLIAPALVALVTVMITGCQGIKLSVDNAELQKGTHFDTNGKLTNIPEVSLPIWSSKGLKPKPRDIRPDVSQAQ